MAAKNDSGAAFPTDAHPLVKTHAGMTLRDWFAGQALAAIDQPKNYIGSEVTAKSYRDAAESAYRLADAMLKARS